MSLIAESERDLFKRVAKSFVENFRRVMSVSGEDEYGDPAQLTLRELADRSGVGRSTVASYSSKDNEHPNPDLRTICQLADALHVSPAFLLMRPEDWSRFAQAIMFFSEAARDERFRTLARELFELRAVKPVIASSAGLRVAEKLNIFDSQPKAVGGQFEQLLKNKRKRVRIGIQATSSLPPLGELENSLIPVLLSICAIIGAQVD